MPSWVDGKGTRWPLSLTVAIVDRLREESELDLYRVHEDNDFERKIRDPLTLGDVFLSLHGDGVLDVLDVPSLERGIEALASALTLFYPEPTGKAGAPITSWQKWAYQAGGVLGVDPGPYSIRQLAWMVEAHGRDRWNHTSHVLAMMANVNSKKGRSFKPDQFNPYRRSTGGGIPLEAYKLAHQGDLETVVADPTKMTVRRKGKVIFRPGDKFRKV